MQNECNFPCKINPVKILFCFTSYFLLMNRDFLLLDRVLVEKSEAWMRKLSLKFTW